MDRYHNGTGRQAGRDGNEMEKATFEQARDIIHNLLWDAESAYNSLAAFGFSCEEEKGLYWGRVQSLRNALEKLDAL